MVVTDYSMEIVIIVMPGFNKASPADQMHLMIGYLNCY